MALASRSTQLALAPSHRTAGRLAFKRFSHTPPSDAIAWGPAYTAAPATSVPFVVPLATVDIATSKTVSPIIVNSLAADVTLGDLVPSSICVAYRAASDSAKVLNTTLSAKYLL